MALAFSSDGSKAIESKVPISETDASDTSLETRFSLAQCKRWIEQTKVSKVALQIPDELQHSAAAIVKWLEMQTDCQCFVLADTSYGSCCIDEVSAEHYQADGLVHFGHSCLSATKRLPSLLVFDNAFIDVDDCCREFADVVPDREQSVILAYDVSFYHAVEQVQSKMAEVFPHVTISHLNIATNCCVACDCETFIHRDETLSADNLDNVAKNSHSDGERLLNKNNTEERLDRTANQFNCCGRCVTINNDIPVEQHNIFYIGGESLTLSNLMLLWNGCKFYSYNPRTRICRRESMNTNKMLMRRFYLVEKAKDAQIVGIVVGTLGVANYLQVIDRLKLLLKKTGKKHYTFVVGKLNVAKLANFMEIDIFVLVACHENSLLDSSEFYKPIITPYELELACNPDRQWTGGVVTDFQQLLPGGQSHMALPEGDIEEQHDVSLVTGGVRRMGVNVDTQPASGSNSALVAKDQNNQLVLSGAKDAGDFLSQRSWKGLEPELGKTAVTKAVEGRKGIAISYEEEPNVTS